MIKTLIRCARCNEVIPDYKGDGTAGAESLPGVEWSDTDLVRAEEFLRTHSRHRLEKLIVDPESLVSRKPAYEPLGESFFFARSEGRRFLIRREKMALVSPAFYQIVQGKSKS